MRFDDATARQIRAARPDASTWLTANAGSGKTRVLTDRVARLLLAGVDPQNILCLTYTKAAAGEMQNRLFRTLGAWAMADDAPLAQALGAKGIGADVDLDQARRLFARAIETPGGLKIQTIHSFCGGLLRRFPLEAAVSPQFTEMDDRTAQLLRLEVLDEMAEDARFAALARAYTGGAIEDFAGQIMDRAALFARPMPEAEIAALLGATPGTSAALADLLAEAEDLLDPLVAALRGGSARDIGAADKLAQLQGTTPSRRWFDVLCDVLLTKSGKTPFAAKIGSFPTKKTAAANLALMGALEPLMAQVETLRQPVLADEALARTRVLYAFAAAFVPRVQARMQARGLMGFDDLITRAKQLLSDPAVAAWVLWRLDGGIDHILVDEAQDTSPDQWAVVRLLAQEFAAGQGARADRERTLFVVGDRKQSIYSFQGADPDEFDRMNAYFSARLEGLQSLSLDHSFRSSRVILDLVDRVFTGPAAEGLEAQVRHLAFKDQMPGRVDLWPVVEPEDTPEESGDWTTPTDQISPLAPPVRLAQQIAARIRHMVDHETLPEEQDGVWHQRPITEGDVLILVRRRGDLFQAILRECKKAGLRVAGADRLRLGSEMAVNDLRALLGFLALPEDDLALATALRSPLFGWSEAQLFDLAHGREGYLWPALRRRQDHARTRAILEDLRNHADFMRPFDLLSRVLIRHGGRAALLARLGDEAEEGIDALLAQSLVYESAQVPSLTGFLVWLSTEEVEVKRQLDSRAQALRVMTVHGAKGLEAPIVFLPDTAQRTPTARGDLMVRDDLALWRPRAEAQPDSIKALSEEDRARDLREARRLLYVGMTRAERWLIVAAAGKTGTDQDSWYAMIEGAMGAAAAERPEGGALWRLEHGAWTGLPPLAQEPARPPAPLPPAVPAPAPPAEAVLSPSDLGGAKVLPGDPGEADKEAAMWRGTLLHGLLEHLPRVAPAARAAVAARIVGDDAANGDLPDLAIGLLSDPSLAHIFTQGQPEVEITAPLPQLGGARILGAIDRLLVQEGEVIAVDYKSNRLVPQTPAQTPEGLLRQMGAYGAALHQIYPGHRVRTAILWTHSAQLMFLPGALTEAALARASVT